MKRCRSCASPPEGDAPSDPTQHAGPKTPVSGTDLSTSSRKVWQVSQKTTPAPLTTSPPTAKPAPPTTNDLRKTNPPSGSLNLELALSFPTRNGEAKKGSVTAPQICDLPVHLSSTASEQTVAVPSSVPQAAHDPETVPAARGQGASWEDFLKQAEVVVEVTGRISHPARRKSTIKTQRGVARNSSAGPRGKGGIVALAAPLWAWSDRRSWRSRLDHWRRRHE